MRKDTFGSPQARDGMARYDRVINNAGHVFMRALSRAGGVWNRPTGSEVLSSRQKREEYLAMKDDPQQLMEQLGQHIQVAGNPITGANNWAKWIRQMEQSNGSTDE